MTEQNVSVAADPVSAIAKAVEATAGALNSLFQAGGALLLRKQENNEAEREFLRDTFRLPTDVFAQYRDVQATQIIIYASFGLVAIALVAMATSKSKKA